MQKGAGLIQNGKGITEAFLSPFLMVPSLLFALLSTNS